MLQPIEFGHKFAVVFIGMGEDIIKYGEVIDMANRDIHPGLNRNDLLNKL